MLNRTEKQQEEVISLESTTRRRRPFCFSAATLFSSTRIPFVIILTTHLSTVNALVPSDKPVCGSLKLTPYPHNLGLFLILNRQIWNPILSSVPQLSPLEPRSTLPTCPCLLSSHPYSTFCQRGRFRDFMDAWLRHERASPSFAVA